MILIDGKPGDCLPADDRGLAYGDGLFETIAVRAGAARHLDAHLERLVAGASRLAIEPPPLASLREEVSRLASDTDRAVIKLILTRGSGGRGYAAPQPSCSRRILSVHPWPDFHPGPLTLRVCETRLSRNPDLAGIKHLNRLPQVLARAEWDGDDIHEGVMLDTAAEVVECTSANIFLVRGGSLETPVLDQAGVAGVARRILLENAESVGLVPSVRRLTLDALVSAEEILVTNAITGVRPVARIASHVIPTGPWAPRLAAVLEAAE